MIISLDIGTSKICALSYDPQHKRIIDMRSCSNNCGIPSKLSGAREQDPVKTLDICLRLSKDLVNTEYPNKDSVECICITGQMHGVVIVNNDCEPIGNLITWEDTRVLNAIRGNISELIDRIDVTRLSKYGYCIQPGHGIATLYWLKENGLLPTNCKALSITGFVTAYLCGRIATDPTHAASWGLYDLDNEEWNFSLAEQAGIVSEILPEIIPTGTKQGSLRTDLAKQLGIKGSVIVTSGIGDNHASVIGATNFADDTVLNLGTGGQLSIPLNEKYKIKGLEIRPMYHGKYIAVADTRTGGSGYTNLKDFLKDTIKKICGIAVEDNTIYQKLNEVAQNADKESCLQVKTFCQGTNSDRNLTGKIEGITKDNFVIDNLTYEFGRAIVRDLYDKLNSQACEKIKTLIVAGNFPQRNPFILSIVQDLFGVACKMSDNKEEAAYGAAMIAARSVKPAMPFEKEEIAAGRLIM
jgi:sugar (pentulose or hexulose) kinase